MTTSTGDTKPWAQEPPDNSRLVLALYRRHLPQGVIQVIVAEFGSEGRWLARDHDYRLTYLDSISVLGWRELPDVPDELRGPSLHLDRSP